MERQFINTVLGQVRKRMKSFEVPGCRQSRRIEGMFSRDDEMHGFKNLCIYIDTALTDRVNDISEILGQIDCFIYGQEHYNHTRWLMLFGCNPDRLVASRPSKVYQAIRASAWRVFIASRISENPSTGISLIPRLHNPGSSITRFPDRNDLALFFCKGKDVYTYEEQLKNFAAIRQRSLWFVFGDKDLPKLDTERFVSAVKEILQSKSDVL
jgi:hypothetical protein